MKSLVCEMCNSNDLVKQDGLFVCQYCGTKYTVEEARKMMIEGTVDVRGTVKVDNTDSISKYLANARRALMKEDWEEVEKYYNMVEQNSDYNMEAVFFSSYGKAMLSLTDTDYFKREQKFGVLNRSIAVISDYYEQTTEDKEDVLKRINTYIKKMFQVSFVYERQAISVRGAIRSISAVTGSHQWCLDLLNSTKNSFVAELKQIAQKYNETFIKLLISEYEYLKISDSELSQSNKTIETHKLTVKRLWRYGGSARKIKVSVSNGQSFDLRCGDEKTLDLKYGTYNIKFTFGSGKPVCVPVVMKENVSIQCFMGAWGLKAEII